MDNILFRQIKGTKYQIFPVLGLNYSRIVNIRTKISERTLHKNLYNALVSLVYDMSSGSFIKASSKGINSTGKNILYEYNAKERTLTISTNDGGLSEENITLNNLSVLYKREDGAQTSLLYSLVSCDIADGNISIIIDLKNQSDYQLIPFDMDEFIITIAFEIY